MRPVDYYHQYRNVLGALLFLALGVVVAVQAFHLGPRQVMTADLARLKQILDLENRTLADLKKAEDAEASTSSDDDRGIKSLPAFLKHINRISQDTNVIIRELVPSTASSATSGGALKFKLSITTDYLTFLRFAAKLESLNVGINDLQVRPYDPTKTPVEHAIAFSITPRDDAKPLESARIDTIQEKVSAKNKRNPFQRFAYNKSEPKPSPWIDLTWIHRLSGIGRIGGERIATIDSRDYAVGDPLDNMSITEIRNDRVMLKKESADGEQIFVLGFRKKARSNASQ
jgi:hypothetical protein